MARLEGIMLDGAEMSLSNCSTQSLKRGTAVVPMMFTICTFEPKAKGILVYLGILPKTRC